MCVCRSSAQWHASNPLTSATLLPPLPPQDVVSLGLHSALTALDACELLKPAVAIHLLAAAQVWWCCCCAASATTKHAQLLSTASACCRSPPAAQAVDLRQGAGQLGASTARLHRALRHISARLEADRPLDADVAAVVAAIDARALPVVPVWGGAGGVAAGREAS